MCRYCAVFRQGWYGMCEAVLHFALPTGGKIAIPEPLPA
jgi:hypothetical protein